MKRDDLLDLNDALQHPGRVVAVDVETELSEESDLDLVKPLEGFIEAVSTGNILLVKGQFKTRAVLECARCSGPLETDVTFDVEEEFAVAGVPASMAQGEFATVVDEDPFPVFDGNQLKVEDLLRQGLLLALPNQPLCQYGWDGACPQADAGGVPVVDAEVHARPEFSRLRNLVEGTDPTDEDDAETAT